MTRFKLYLYDSTKADYKGTDYSANIMAGLTYTDDLTEVLDVCDLTLVGIDRAIAFDPSTKFILEKWEVGENSSMLVDSYSLCVANDVVAKPELRDDNYYNHSITFNEASVLAQGRIVDNCSETYRLKDVNLNKAPVFDPNATVTADDNEIVKTYGETNGEHTYSHKLINAEYDFLFTRKYRFVFGSEYGLSGSINNWTNILENRVVPNVGTNFTLPIPLIATYVGKKGETAYDTHPNFCSVVTKISWKPRVGGDWTSQLIYTNPSTSNATENDWQTDWNIREHIVNPTSDDYKGIGTNRVDYAMITSGATTSAQFRTRYKRFATFDNVVQNRQINITLLPDRIYKFEVYLALQQTANIPSEKIVGNTELFVKDNGENPAYYSYCRLQRKVIAIDYKESKYEYTSTGDTKLPYLGLTINTYAESSTSDIMFHKAPPLNAYDLFVDAQLKTELRKKVDGVYIKDSELTYYCSQNDIDMLKNTQIIESSYHQKNFWEILLEIGKYIHAIPYITFGENDRFLVNWEYLGRTDIQENNSTPISIFNSRSIENYVSALNSYVNNAIQIGGSVEEWVAPKSESQDYLCYNDVAAIKTSKPIIEILDFKIKCIRDNELTPNITIAANNGDPISLINYIFENSIYECLDVVESFTPNRGHAIYYNLGENMIRGLNYQTPAVNQGDPPSQYAIKKIIASVYNEAEANIKDIIINDFVFYIKYRTKETIRSEQSRPDIRKYLMASTTENVPYHKQFNNQQDVSVDAVKFGNQTYGKLIKTGNDEYATTEWNDSYANIKQAGNLVRIGGNLYYASKIVTTYYQDFSTSEVTYSKDYNQLSEIIGIPSEPRFYEISERNIIDRQKNLDQYLTLGTTFLSNRALNFIAGESSGMEWVKNILFGNETYPKCVITQFKNDKLLVVDDVPNINEFYKEVLHPISAYSMRNTLSLKWGMEDNFSAGDMNEKAWVKEEGKTLIADGCYSTLLPVQYCDQIGRAELMDFAILKNIPYDYTKVNKLPLSPIRLYYARLFRNYIGKAKYLRLDDGVTEIPIDTTTISTGLHDPNEAILDENHNVLKTYNDLSQYDYFYVEGSSSTPNAIFYCSAVSTNLKTIRRELAEFGNDFEYVRNTLAINTTAELTPILSSERNGDFINLNFGTNRSGVALLKDNREKIQFNLNLQLVTDSDRFVLSGIVWEEQKGNIKLALLNKEVNKISNELINDGDILRDSSDNQRVFNIQFSPVSNGIQLDINSMLLGEDLSEVKALAIIREDRPVIGTGTQRYFVMARNVSDLLDVQKRANWYIFGGAKFTQQ